MNESWQIKHLPKAERCLKRFLKRFRGSQKEIQLSYYLTLMDGLKEHGIHALASREPLPGGVTIPPLIEFWKIRFNIPKLSGSLSKLRILYIRNIEKRLVIIIAVYTHKDYEKRPPDDVLSKLINEALRKS